MPDTKSPPAQSVSPLPADRSSAIRPPRWHPSSLAIIAFAWLILQIGGLFSPGLLDDVDSIYIEIAREMLHRHDFTTPYINGIRFFDKPPLMYWMASSSMAVFGESDWAARLPLAFATLALFLSVYALGRRLFSTGVFTGNGKVLAGNGEVDDRAGLYAALAVATSVGPYLYTRFFIPDILICLWMTLGVHLFLIALDRMGAAQMQLPPPEQQSWVPHLRDSLIVAKVGDRDSDALSLPRLRSSLLPCLAFAVILALNSLTKGLIGLVFPIGFVLVYLVLTRQLRLLRRLHPVASTAAFLIVAAPWHILAALRNPAIALPPGLGLPANGGWAWFYLYNEHFARFLSKRIPHDYGNTPVWLFWTYLAIWLVPWTAFLPSAIILVRRHLGHRFPVTARQREAALSLTLWAALVLLFFSISSRQEYYSLPAIPALALMVGGFLARADAETAPAAVSKSAARSALRGHLWLLLPLTTLIASISGYFALTAPHSAPGTDIATLLNGNPDLYNLSLGHIFDLTGNAMGLFRAPLAGVALSMVAIGPGSYLLRRSCRTFAANLTLVAAMLVTLTCAHEGLRRFYPILGSRDLALAVNHVRRPNDLILLDGEFTSGSTLVFYTHQQVHLLNGRVNTLWYGSFWPDAPSVFETEATLRTLWAGPRRIFLFTYNAPTRTHDLAPYGRVYTLAAAGGKTILTNR